MTRILAVDTSTWWGGVALVAQREPGESPQVVAESGVAVEDSHAAHLVGWIERLLDAAGWSRTDLDAYVATRGPGSFTGIRVGLGTIRGLSLAAGRPCFGVSTLEALAQAHGPAELPRRAVMNAGRGQWFTACFDPVESPPRELDPPALRWPEEALASLPQALLVPAPGTHPGAVPYPSRVARSPRSVAAAAASLVALRGIAAIAPLSPLYLRPPDALVKRERS